MKSQFSKIAKIRKQKCDSIERELVKSQNKEKLLKYKIAALYEEIGALNAPKEGMVSMLSTFAEHKKILSRDKKTVEQELVVAHNNTLTLQSAYQKAHIEYEKIHYLEEQELQAIIDKLKKEEQLALDEISTQLFANQMQKKVAQ
jgi:elongation factor P--beta-lysine ligase